MKELSKRRIFKESLWAGDTFMIDLNHFYTVVVREREKKNVSAFTAAYAVAVTVGHT